MKKTLFLGQKDTLFYTKGQVLQPLHQPLQSKGQVLQPRNNLTLAFGLLAVGLLF